MTPLASKLATWAGVATVVSALTLIALLVFVVWHPGDPAHTNLEGRLLLTSVVLGLSIPGMLWVAMTVADIKRR